MGTQKISIPALAAEELMRAAIAHTGRSSGPVFGSTGKAMHQVLIALKQGASLREHDNPGEVTLYVIQGHIQLSSGGELSTASVGDLIIIPQAPHSIEALEDSAFLMTAVREQSIAHH